jgi:hypothetical protein
MANNNSATSVNHLQLATEVYINILGLIHIVFIPACKSRFTPYCSLKLTIDRWMRAEERVRSTLSPERALPKELAKMTRYYTQLSLVQNMLVLHINV